MPAPETDRPGKVFVGGLASDIDEAILEKYFSHYGRLTEVIVKRDKNTQQTRGYAFITFDDPYDAEDAIKNMDKKEIHGRQIYVEQAVKPRHEQQQIRQPPRVMSRGGGRSVRGGPRGRGRGSSSLGSRRSPVSMRSERQMGRGPDRVGPPRRSSYEAPPRRDGGDRYGGVDRRMDRGPPPRSRDPPLSRSRDDFTPPREYRGLPDSRMGRNSGRDFQQTSRYDAPMRDYSPPPREYQSSRDMDYERGPVRGDRLSSRDYGSAPSGRDFSSGPSRGRGGRSSMYTDGPRDRDVYSGGRDRDPPSRDFISSREFSNRSAQRASDFDRVQSRDYDSFREGGRSVQSSRTFSSMGSGRDSAPVRQRAYESPVRIHSSRGVARGPAPSTGRARPTSHSPPPRSRGPPPREDRDRDSYSAGQRRPATSESRGGPPVKRARPSGPSRGSRSGPPMRR